MTSKSQNYTFITPDESEETGEIIVKQSQKHERHGKNELTNNIKAIIKDKVIIFKLLFLQLLASCNA